MKPIIFSLMLWLLAMSTQAQVITPVTFSTQLSKDKPSAGEEITLTIKAEVIKDWYIYGTDFDPALGPMLTTLKNESEKDFTFVGKLKALKAKTKYDDLWGGNVQYLTGKAVFEQRLKVKTAGATLKATLEGQTCTDVDGKCIPFTEDLVIQLKAPAKAAEAFAKAPKEKEVKNNQVAASQQTSSINVTAAANDSTAEEAGTDSITLTQNEVESSKIGELAREAELLDQSHGDTSLWGFFVIAFLAGLVGLLTPCVFPMIPMTVSIFTKFSSSRAEGLRKAGFYGFSIIAIYTIIGTIISRINGPEFANFLSTHWAPNLLFFAVFIIFGISFLGAFEIVLPSRLVNRADREADKGGYYGIFFMAFTLSLVSFSCTGPIVGSILVESAGGAILKPIVGMFGFSLAFAIPFTLFAIFPKALQALPQSGGWLNSIKVTLGFIELALALKFLSIADQAYHWNLLDREIYLAFWIVIFTLLGLYFLGKINMPHDSPSEKTTVTGVILAIITFSFVVYLIPGMWGAPLKSLAGYLPPQNTIDFDLYSRANVAASPTDNTLCDVQPRHADLLHFPPGFKGYFDYEEALACAKEQNKPVLIDFTGHGCVNCREMEARVWTDDKVRKIINQDYILLALYVDDKTELPESEWYTSSYDNKVKTTIGKQNADFQITRFNNNAQPFYVVLDPSGKLLISPRAYDLDIAGFIAFLDSGKAAMKTAI